MSQILLTPSFNPEIRPKSPSPRVHPNGEELITISDIQRVYDHSERIPLRFFSQGGMQGMITPGSRVTTLEVARALRARKQDERDSKGGCVLHNNTQ